jgi:DNA (cytosine-5)-methyltransferase 1
MNYYNENDPKPAAWLRELMKQGLIPEGHVDERSITETKAADLRGFTQCHFFAGIGGWPLALKLAGYPGDRPVWTASLPCQPFSTAGQSQGVEDGRHLWPIFFDLVKVCRPNIIFGEQVARAIGFNWLDGISTDLEGADYTVGQAVCGAHSVGAPHKRKRLYWLGVSEGYGREAGRLGAEAARYGHSLEPASGVGVTLDDAKCSGLEGFGGDGNGGNEPGRIAKIENGPTTASGATRGLAHAGHSERCPEQGNELRECDSGTRESGAWSNYDLLYFRDDKFRRVEAGTFPLAHGVSGRVGLLRGYGNGIVPQLAAEFIQASLEAILETRGTVT